MRTGGGRSTATSRCSRTIRIGGDTGEGLGASHQTGWTALVAKLIDQLARYGPHTHAKVAVDSDFKPRMHD
jgi:hypothetical protein